MLLRQRAGGEATRELRPTESDRGVVTISIFDADHGLAKMILGAAGEIFQAELVFNGDDQDPSGAQEAARPREKRIDGVANSDLEKQAGIFKHADQRHHIELRVGGKFGKIICDHPDIGEIRAAAGGNGSPACAAFDRDDLRAAFAQIASHRAGAGADLQNPAFQQVAKRSQQIGAKGTEMIICRPIRNRFVQFERIRCSVDGRTYDRRDSLFNLVAIGIEEGADRAAAPKSVYCIEDIIRVCPFSAVVAGECALLIRKSFSPALESQFIQTE